jgi:hypothetical protein
MDNMNYLTIKESDPTIKINLNLNFRGETVLDVMKGIEINLIVDEERFLVHIIEDYYRTLILKSESINDEIK